MKSFDQQYQAKQARFFPNEELCRFLGKTYGNPWPSYSMCQGLRAGEIGCGSGANLKALFYWGFAFCAVDSSQEAMTLAWEVLEEEQEGLGWGCALQCMSVPPLPWPSDSLDLIVDIQVLQHMNWDDHVKTYAEVFRVLKPGGRFFSQHLLYADIGLFPDHPELTYTQATTLVDAMAKAGLEARYTVAVERNDITTGKGAIWGSFEAVKP